MAIFSRFFHFRISHFSAKTFRSQNRPYLLCKPRTRNSRANGRSLLSGAEEGWGEGESERDWGEKRKIRLKNTIETDKEKIKERKRERKKKDSYAV